MKRLFLVPALLLVCSSTALAQDKAETAQVKLARELYAQFNKPDAQLAVAHSQAQRADVGYRSELKAWADATGIRKIQASDRDDHGDVISDYYFKDRELIFVYQATHGYDENGKPKISVEDRQYFRKAADGSTQMFKWLAGLEKTEVEHGTAEFKEQGASRVAAAKRFQITSEEALWRSRSPGFIKVGNEYKYQYAKITQAQPGDTACYLSLTDDAGASFAELAEFALCEDPQLIGKRVKLNYTETTVIAASCEGDPACTDSEATIVVSGAEVAPK